MFDGPYRGVVGLKERSGAKPPRMIYSATWAYGASEAMRSASSLLVHLKFTFQISLSHLARSRAEPPAAPRGRDQAMWFQTVRHWSAGNMASSAAGSTRTSELSSRRSRAEAIRRMIMVSARWRSSSSVVPAPMSATR
jgi:hypothetical protein